MAITMTPAAESHVIRHLEHRDKGIGIRLGVRTTGCSGLSYVLEFVDEKADEDDSFTKVHDIATSDFESKAAQMRLRVETRMSLMMEHNRDWFDINVRGSKFTWEHNGCNE